MSRSNTATGKLSPEGNGAGEARWMLVSLVTHLAWGAYPVLSRYLQNTHHVGTISLAALSNSLAAIVLLLTMARHLDFRSIRLRDILLMSFIVIVRSLTNLYATRMTNATNVQLLALLSPFVIAYISATFMGEPLPRHTGAALVLSLLGSVGIISASIPRSGAAASDAKNLIGIGLAVVSGIFLAFYMIFIKEQGKRGASAQTLAFVQFASNGLLMTAGSVAAGEDWRPWLNLPVPGILAFLVFSIAILLLMTVLQNDSLKMLGAPTYSTIQALRLVGTIIFSWIILGEGISTIWQAFGSLVVLATVTWYMLLQKKDFDRKKAAGLKPATAKAPRR